MEVSGVHQLYSNQGIPEKEILLQKQRIFVTKPDNCRNIKNGLPSMPDEGALTEARRAFALFMGFWSGSSPAAGRFSAAQ
jgi:hypothetical protein